MARVVECMLGRVVKHHSPAELTKESMPTMVAMDKGPESRTRWTSDPRGNRDDKGVIKNWKKSEGYYPLRESYEKYQKRMDRLGVPERERYRGEP